MTKCAPGWRLFLFLCLVFSLVGCSQLKRSSVDDEKDPHFMEGKRRAGGLDMEGAIESFERALQSNPNNAAAHRELGIIYYNLKTNPAFTIYHYQKHLKLQPNSPMATLIKQQIDSSKRDLAKTDGLMPVDREVQAHLERLSMTNEFLRNRVLTLESQLARGPQYITNEVVKYVQVPTFAEGSSRHLTKPAEIVPAPEQDQAALNTPSEGPDEEPVRKEREVQRAQPRESRTPPVRNNQTAANRKPPVVPAAKTKSARAHTVRPGETMDVLARRYGVSVAELKAANPGSSRGVRAGQTIKVPAK